MRSRRNAWSLQVHGLLLLAILAGTPSAGIAQEWIYTVRPGDSLWDIAKLHLTHVRFVPRLQRLNGIDDPTYVRPGTRLRIPLEWVRLELATAKVVALHGAVAARRAHGDTSHEVGQDTELHTGDRLITGPDGSATIEFGDGSKMLVEPDSEVVFDLLQAYGKSGFVDTRVRLKSGRTEHKVRPRKRGPRYEIITPAATTAVRGTRYRLATADAGQATSTEVLAGGVEVATDSAALDVPQGFGVIARRDIAPAAPRRLLPAPNLDALPTLLDRLPLRMQLATVPTAVRYHVQIAETDQFQTLRYDELLDKPQLRGANLPDGDYVLRQRGVDLDGLEGTDGMHRFTVDARPEPPVTLGPPDKALFGDDAIVLRWAQPEGAASYRVQISSDPSFASLLIDEPAWRANAYELSPDLPPGTYHWRLATRDQRGENGPLGDPRQFKRLSTAPAVQAPGIDDERVVFSWATGLPGDRFELQFARDDEFKQLVGEAVITEPTYAFARPDSGVYYLRVRTIDTEGDAGPFGTTQRVEIPPSSYWPLAIPGLMLLLAL